MGLRLTDYVLACHLLAHSTSPEKFSHLSHPSDCVYIQDPSRPSSSLFIMHLVYLLLQICTYYQSLLFGSLLYVETML